MSDDIPSSSDTEAKPVASDEPGSNERRKNQPSSKKSLIFERICTGRLCIKGEVLKRMKSFTMEDPDALEAGGVLMGRYIKNTRDVIVDEITVPKPGDLRSSYRFFRTHEQHQERIEQAWERSEHTCTYLGEWHTHSEPNPTPSHVDRSEWRRKLMTDDFGSHLFFVIVGTEAIRAWEGKRRSQRVSKLFTNRNF
jgi:integrative and conjugative element protein (TIGR02256 family)